MKNAFAILCILASTCALGQSYTAVTAVNTQVDNGSGGAVNPPSGSNLCFLGVNNVGAAITYTPSGGSPVSGPVCQTLDGSGNLTGSFQVANPATASPIGLRYTITITEGSTTYLTIPEVSISGALFQFSNFTLPVNGKALGIGFPHLSCVPGAAWTSTTLPSGQQAFTCNLVSGVGTWQTFPKGGLYCPAGMGYVTPQVTGTPFCIPPVLSNNGVPTGSCINGSTYYQQDDPGVAYGCVNGAWSPVAGGGVPGLTSFQGRSTPGATVQSGDITGILQNGPFGLTGTQSLLFDEATGTAQPSSNWKLGTGANAGKLYGYKDFNLAPNGASPSTATINAVTGAATLAGGSFTVDAAGVAAMAAGSTLNGSTICTTSNGLCPTSGAAYYQTAQNAATPLTQRSRMNFITSSGIEGIDNSGNASTNVSLASIPNASLLNNSITVNVTGSATGGGTIPLGGSTTINVASSGVPAGSTKDVQLNLSSAFGADPGMFIYDTASHFLSSNTNGSYDSDLYRTGGTGNDGLANLLAGPCSTGNCTPMFPGTSTSTEHVNPASNGNSTHVQDFRLGSQGDYFRNPVAGGGGGTNFIGSQYSGAKTFYANWDAPTLDAVSYPGQTQTTQTMFNNFSSPGFNFGSWGGPYLGPLWSVQHGITMYQNVYTQGIAQVYGCSQNKYAAGDSQCAYFYNTTDGGFKDGAGEGSTGIGVHTDEHSTWFHGTANAGNTSGTQSLKATYVPGTFSRPQTSTEGIMLDISNIVLSNAHVTGPAVLLSGITAWATPIDATVTPSTAYGIANAAIPVPIGTITPQTDTVSFTVMGGTNAGGYTTGVACLDGQAFNEQVAVTAVGAISGGVQSVTFIHRYPDTQVGTSLWQGGPCGTYYVPLAVPLFMGNWRVAYPVVGATDSTHIVGQFSNGGVVRLPIPNYYTSSSANVQLTNLAISGTTVTADFFTANTSKTFDGMSSAVISNSTNTSYNGNISNVKLTNNNQSLTWTQTGPVGTSATAYISLSPNYFNFSLMGGAQVTQPSTSAGIPLEPNNVPWVSGSVLENVFDPSYRGYGFSSGQVINSPDSSAQSGIGNISLSASGNGVSGQFKFFGAGNGNASTLYKGGGGLLDAPRWIDLKGIGSSVITTDTAPINGAYSFSLGCFIASQGGCGSTTNDYKVISVANGAGNFTFSAPASEWFLNNIKTARTRSNILSTGTGIYINGNFPGVPVALTSASGVAGNSSAALGTYGTFGNETVLDASAKMGAAGFYAETIYGGATAPGTAVIATQGAAGSTTYTYACASVTQSGTSLPGATGSITTGNATLSGANYNGIQCLPGYGSQGVNVYRATTVGSYSAGLICASVANKDAFSSVGYACKDTGQAAGAAVPTADTSGKVQSPSGVFGAATVGGSAVCRADGTNCPAAAAGALTGTILNSIVVNSSLTSVGTLDHLDVTNTVSAGSVAAGNGFTGTKTAGTCLFTIVSGIITNVGGC